MSLESAFRTFVEEAKISRHAREEILEELENSDIEEFEGGEKKLLEYLNNQVEEFDERIERLEAEHDLRGGENGEE